MVLMGLRKRRKYVFELFLLAFVFLVHVSEWEDFLRCQETSGSSKRLRTKLPRKNEEYQKIVLCDQERTKFSFLYPVVILCIKF